MGWENRNGKQYYYRKRWKNGTCVSEYIGTGLLADAIGKLTQLEQIEERQKRETWKQEQAQFLEVDRHIDELCSQIRTITRAVLRSTGHHRHKGQWRKKRMSQKKIDRTEMNDYLKRLEKGKGTKQDKENFKKALKDVPDILKIYDLVRIARQNIFNTMFGEDQALLLANKQMLENVKQELGYVESSRLEQLLIEQILLCHLRLYWIENLMTPNLKNATMKQLQHWEIRLSANQRRYFRAIETLARVRKLASRTPEILQVNIAQQQVNQIEA